MNKITDCSFTFSYNGKDKVTAYYKNEVYHGQTLKDIYNAINDPELYDIRATFELDEDSDLSMFEKMQLF